MQRRDHACIPHQSRRRSREEGEGAHSEKTKIFRVDVFFSPRFEDRTMRLEIKLSYHLRALLSSWAAIFFSKNGEFSLIGRCIEK